MPFEFDCVPQQSLVHLIQRASATTGFSPAEIAALVNSELSTDQLLAYITAVISNRMN